MRERPILEFYAYKEKAVDDYYHYALYQNDTLKVVAVRDRPVANFVIPPSGMSKNIMADPPDQYYSKEYKQAMEAYSAAWEEFQNNPIRFTPCDIYEKWLFPFKIVRDEYHLTKEQTEEIINLADEINRELVEPVSSDRYTNYILKYEGKMTKSVDGYCTSLEHLSAVLIEINEGRCYWLNSDILYKKSTMFLRYLLCCAVLGGLTYGIAWLVWICRRKHLFLRLSVQPGNGSAVLYELTRKGRLCAFGGNPRKMRKIKRRRYYKHKKKLFTEYLNKNQIQEIQTLLNVAIVQCEKNVYRDDDLVCYYKGNVYGSLKNGALLPLAERLSGSISRNME